MSKAGHNLIEALHTAALAVVQGMRRAAKQAGTPCDDLHMPILMGDMRVTIEHGPRVAARNTTEAARLKAGGKSASPTDKAKALRHARLLLAQHADYLATRTDLPPGDPADACTRLHQRCLQTIKALEGMEVDLL